MCGCHESRSPARCSRSRPAKITTLVPKPVEQRRRYKDYDRPAGSLKRQLEGIAEGIIEVSKVKSKEYGGVGEEDEGRGSRDGVIDGDGEEAEEAEGYSCRPPYVASLLG